MYDVKKRFIKIYDSKMTQVYLEILKIIAEFNEYFTNETLYINGIK